MADHSLPTSSSTYANFVAQLSARFNDLAQLLDPAVTTATNVPTNSIRWNSANNRFEKFDGTNWNIWTTTLALTNLSATGTVTLGGGTANGVLYLNGSKVATSGSALTFDGTNLGLGTTSPVFSNSGSGLMVNGATAGVVRVTQGGTTQAGEFRADATNIYIGSRTNGALVFEQFGSEQMRLTSTGLGIGTTSVSTGLRLVKTPVSSADYFNNTIVSFETNTSDGLAIYRPSATTIGIKVNASREMVFGIGDATPTEGMRLTSTGLGIGTSSPSNKLTVYTAAAGNIAYFWDQTSSDFLIKTASALTTIGTTSSSALAFQTVGAERMRLDASGNLGLGVTPSAWGSTIKSIQVSANSSVYGNSSATGVGFNYYHNGTNELYLTNNSAVKYLQTYNGEHRFYTAPSGTAGSAITFTQAMTLFASGGLSLGNTTDPGASNLSVSGTVTDGTATLRPLVLSTSQATTSGTSKDFTGIPSWVKKITVLLQGVSTNGTSTPRVRLGSGGTPATTGYVGVTALQITGTSASSLSAGFDVSSGWATAANAFSGAFVFCLLSGNIWTCNSMLSSTGSGTVGLNVISGYVTLSGALDIVRITTVNGTDTFDAGSVNILFE